MATLVLRTVLLLGLAGTSAASLQISVGGDDVTDAAYFAKLGESITFTCKGGSNASWTVSTVPVGYSAAGDGLYQSSNGEGEQLLHVPNFIREQAAIYTCKDANSLQAYVGLKEDILDTAIALNSTAIMVSWSSTPNTGLVQCCPDVNPCRSATVNTSLNSHVFSGLNEYTRYSVSLKGESREVFIVTYQDRPSAAPRFIRFFIESSLQVTISWELPLADDRNGIITSYELNCIVTNSAERTSIEETLHVVAPRFDSPSEQSYQLNAKHQSTYMCSVSAATVNGSGPASNRSSVTVELPKLDISHNGDDSVIASWEVPHVVAEGLVQNNVSLIYNELGTGGEKFIISVPVASTKWTINNLAAGVPYEAIVKVGVFNIITASKTELFFTKELEPLVAVERLSAIAINTTAIRVNWTELSLSQARGFPVYTIHIESKANSWYNTISARSAPMIVTGLLPATQYTVSVEVSTAASPTGAGKVSSSASVETRNEEVPTEVCTDGTAAPLIAPVAVGVGVGTAATVITTVVLLFLVVLVCLCLLRWRSIRGKAYRHQEDGQVLFETGDFISTCNPAANRESMLFGDSFAQDLLESNSAKRGSYENTRPPVKVSEFSEYIYRMRAENSFTVEFDNMPKRASACRSDAEAETNKPKNRFQTMLPYNESRVVLTGQNNYINASYVKGYRKEKAYIATQGPLESTVGDFWQMIWEQNCCVIVMLTNLTEGGSAKCHKYWEDELTKPLDLPNGISIKQVEHTIFAEYESRTFTVTHSDHPKLPARTVNHFQYTAWPDYQVPKYPASLVRFVQTVRHLYKDEGAPMVVHCSAGVGRTGTFIAVDAMMQRLQERDDINIYEFLYEMRNCRMHLIMNVEQYEFVHEAVCDFAMCGYTHIDATRFGDVLAKLMDYSEEGCSTNIEEQFQLLDQLSRKPSKKDNTFAQLHVEDNRYETRYPYVSNRVVISKPSESKYINAAPIDSYSKRHAFIAAETPSPDKVELVLGIVAQRHCSTMVVLCTEKELKEVSFCKFWPSEEGANMSFGQYSLQLITKYSKDMFTVLKITITWNEEHHHFTLIHVHGWTEDSEPEPSLVWNAIQECEKAQKGITAPAVVMCNDGMGRTGAFICMCSEVERMRMEGSADIFQSVKAARNQRPYMVSTVDQYVLIHKVMLCFLKTFQIYDNFGPAMASTNAA